MQNKNIAVIVVIASIVGLGAFYGGTVYEKNRLASQGVSRNPGANFGNRQEDGQQRPGRPGGAAGSDNTVRNGGFIAGQITAKDDKSITVKTLDGSSKIVFFSDSTTINKAAQGSATDLNVGGQVIVNGKGSADGSLSAQNIQIRPKQ
ncbi:MAG: DUF5666 domain-containing protein [Candidatus Moranbacteria bacterium]|nr:DUF5666 domain-containing protein [Candidatus Moranbacteria bacterium]MDZ4385307.1 DUF5666 domain-containing protein [Candidatus Moranbacteria bacterium]